MEIDPIISLYSYPGLKAAIMNRSPRPNRGREIIVRIIRVIVFNFITCVFCCKCFISVVFYLCCDLHGFLE